MKKTNDNVEMVRFFTKIRNGIFGCSLMALLIFATSLDGSSLIASCTGLLVSILGMILSMIIERYIINNFSEGVYVDPLFIHTISYEDSDDYDEWLRLNNLEDNDWNYTKWSEE